LVKKWNTFLLKEASVLIGASLFDWSVALVALTFWARCRAFVVGHLLQRVLSNLVLQSKLLVFGGSFGFFLSLEVIVVEDVTILFGELWDFIFVFRLDSCHYLHEFVLDALVYQLSLRIVRRARRRFFSFVILMALKSFGTVLLLGFVEDLPSLFVIEFLGEVFIDLEAFVFAARLVFIEKHFL
jgi:hypothetical protein